MSRSPLSVLFDAHQVGRRQTGNETYVRALLEEFGNHSDLELRTMVERTAVEDPAVIPSTVHRVPRSGFSRLAVASLLARRYRPNVLHAMYFAPYVSGVPLVLTIHDISHEIHPEFFSRTERLRGKTLIRDGARRARFVITVSETSKRDLVDRYGLAEERVVAIHNGVSRHFLHAPLREAQPIGDRPLRLLALGTLQPRKNLIRLLDAIRIVARTRPVKLRVVGPNGYQAVAIRNALEGTAQAEIVGFVSDQELMSEYVGADMLVYPSIYEGFGLPVVEAMACSTPVVTSTGGSLPEVAGGAAVIIDPYDVSAIAEAILTVAEDVDLRADLIRKGIDRASSFSWAAAAERHIQVYHDAAGA